MWNRNSKVKTLVIKSVLSSAVIEIGDSVHTNATSNAIAVKREQEIYYGNELHFKDYSIFSEPIPIPPLTMPPPLIRKYNELPNICVNRYSVLKGYLLQQSFRLGIRNM